VNDKAATVDKFVMSVNTIATSTTQGAFVRGVVDQALDRQCPFDDREQVGDWQRGYSIAEVLA